MTINRKIREIIEASGWTQGELAYQLGVSSKTLSFWLSGRDVPRAKNVEKIEKLYGDIVGWADVSREDVQAATAKALATHIELDELLENEDLLKTTTLYLTYHTNTIEGSTMTLKDVEEVLADENAVVPDRSVREQMEARNHRSAFLYLLGELKEKGKAFRWTEDVIKNIHLRLMNGLLESAGQYRTHGVRVMGSHAARANAASVPRKMNELVKSMNYLPSDNCIEQMATTHAAFERIHPFGDGNGRTGRLILFGQALQSGIVPPLIIKERKKAYYKCLEIAHIKEDYDPLSLFIAESVLFTDELLRG